VDRFSKFFHQLIHEKILNVHTHKDFYLTCDMLLHYLVKVENVVDFDSILNKLLSCCEDTLNI